MQTRELGLNEVVANISKMLQRILSEDIRLDFKYAAEPLLIHADAGMSDQILLNLTVNARDAMPKGGRIMVETSAAEFDEATASQILRARSGSFACVSVSDTGCGIPAEILPRILSHSSPPRMSAKARDLVGHCLRHRSAASRLDSMFIVKSAREPFFGFICRAWPGLQTPKPSGLHWHLFEGAREGNDFAG